MAKDDPHFRLRVPAGLKEDVEALAKSNNRSVNAEIVQRLEDSFKLNITLPPMLYGRITDAGRVKGRNTQSEAVAALQKAYPRHEMRFSELIEVLYAVSADPGLNPALREQVDDNLDALIEALQQRAGHDSD